MSQRPLVPPGGWGSEEMLRRLWQIVDSSRVAIVVSDLAFKVVSWSEGSEPLFGRSPAGTVGRPLREFLHPRAVANFERRLRAIAAGGKTPRFRATFVRPDGGRFPANVRMWALREAGGPVHRLCIAITPARVPRRSGTSRSALRDVVEREAALRDALTALRESHEELKSTQLRLIQAAKLESVGRLAAGVAHEVKNPLAIILAGTEFLSGHFDAPDRDSILGDIRAAVKRANDVIGGLLNYASATELRPSTAAINQVLEDSLSLVQHALTRNHIQLIREFAGDLPQLSLDVTKIEQVFVNLFINAADAMSEGGTLTVRTRTTQLARVQPDVGVLRTDPLRIGQNVVLVEVLDTGPGLSDAVLHRMFDPFFTTKPTGKGTGLGLAISRTILALHGGTIWIENRSEGGARASVVFRIVRPTKGVRP